MSLLEIDGRARFNALNARKEGKGDVKILAVDLKFSIDTSNEVLIHFHPQLRLMMFDKDGAPRFPVMGAIPWSYEFPNQYVEIQPDAYRSLKLNACRLKNFEFLALDNGKVRVGFSAQVRPSDGDFELMGKILAESVVLKVRNDNLDLFGDKAKQERKAAQLELQVLGTAAPVEAPPAEAAAAQPEATTEVAPAVAEPPPSVQPEQETGDDVVPVINGAGIPLGFRISKGKHPVGSMYQISGITYDVSGQGENSITLLARIPGAPAAPGPSDITKDMLERMKQAGRDEAKKDEDDRDFDTGFSAACKAAGLKRAFVEENLVELQAAFADGFEEEPEGAGNG